jgi:hypothetical protein
MTQTTENDVLIDLVTLFESAPVDKPRNKQYHYDKGTQLVYPNQNERLQSQRVYLSGQMTGLPDWGEAQFTEGTEFLTYFGFRVYNPYLIDPPTHADHNDDRYDLVRYSYRDLGLIQNLTPENGDFVAVLPGWENSRGCKAEVALAAWIQVPVYRLFVSPWCKDSPVSQLLCNNKVDTDGTVSKKLYADLSDCWSAKCPSCGQEVRNG